MWNSGDSFKESVNLFLPCWSTEAGSLAISVGLCNSVYLTHHLLVDFLVSASHLQWMCHCTHLLVPIESHGFWVSNTGHQVCSASIVTQQPSRTLLLKKMYPPPCVCVCVVCKNILRHIFLYNWYFSLLDFYGEKNILDLDMY